MKGKDKIETQIVLFQEKNIRRVLHSGEWFFVIEDIIDLLTVAKDPKDYIKKMKKRDPILGEEWGQLVVTLPVVTGGGQQRMSCSNTQGILRIIQSIPSPKAEPLKMWLSEVGKQRIDEIQNPELAMERMKVLYEQKGYPKEWIL